MTGLRTAFFGRSDEWLSVQGLEITLATPGIEVVTVTAGRGRTTYETDGQLQRLARRHGIALHNLAGVRDTAGPLDLVVSFSNPVVFPDAFIDSVRFGIVNLHPAPLPRYQGCHAIEHAVLEGDPQFAATMHFCDAGIDTGPIIDEEIVPIRPTDTSRDVWSRVDDAALVLLRRTLHTVVNAARAGQRAAARAQDRSAGRYYADDSLPVELRVDLSGGLESMARQVRAYDHPRRSPAFLDVDGHRLRFRFEAGRVVVDSVEPAPSQREDG